MKRLIIVVLTMVCLSVAVYGQTRAQRMASARDMIYLSGALGYQSFLNEDPTLKDGPGAGLEFGVGYQMYRNHFIMSLGAEARYGAYQVRPLDAVLSFNTVDSENDPFTLNASIFNRRDNLHALDLQVPLLFGFEYNHFYFKAGGKFGLNVYGSAVTQALLTATATYERFVDDFGNMPNHQLYENQEVLSARQKILFRPQAYATAEIGYRFDEFYTMTGADVPKSNTRCYVAAFAEYGFLNMHKVAGSGAPIQSQQMPDGSFQFMVAPAYSTDTYRDAVARNFMVGVKLTVMWELPKAPKCVICEEREARNRRKRLFDHY